MSSLPRNKSPTRTSFFREEREEGALYELSFKKVRYRSSGSSDNNEEPVSHLQWETILVRKIKAGTLAKLVENLVPQKDGTLEDVDPGFLMAFLSTYRAFAEVESVLELLMARCRTAKANKQANPEENDRVLKGLVGVMMVWLEQFSSDFNKPPHYTNLKRLNMFVDEEMDEEYTKDLSKKIKEKLQTFIITPYESEGDPMSFRLSMLKDVDYIVEADRKSAAYEGLDFDFLAIKPPYFAEQLTLMDAELFRKVIPWHCLGSVWSSRRRKHKNNTVKNTVDQFNAVLLRVIATILMGPGKKGSGPSKRAKHIIHWISVAQECRDLKNFSSLKAIISGLQSASIHRLKKTWMHVPRDWQLLFTELALIFSEDKNQQMSRDLLMKEGTAKRSDTEVPGLKRLNSLKKRRSRFFNSDAVMQGTVPYLGTFLTDLMMIDTAHPDYVEDEMINFDKRRKEFEIIAQIKLLQEAAKNYTIVPDEKFRHSFDSLMTFTEAECFNISCELEKDSVKKRHSRPILRRNCSEPDIASLSLDSRLTPTRGTLTRQESKSTENSPVLHRHQRNNSNGSSSSCSSTSSKEIPIPIKRASSPCFRRSLLSRASSPPAISITTVVPNSLHADMDGGYIIRVSLDDNRDSGLLYKGVWLGQDERTICVIQKCLQKHGMHGNPSEYHLIQHLHNDNELIFPDNCNVYYAMNSKEEPFTFKLRKKNS